MDLLPIVSTIIGVLLTFSLGLVMAKLNELGRQVITSKQELSQQLTKLDDRLLAHVTSSDLHERRETTSTR